MGEKEIDELLKKGFDDNLFANLDDDEPEYDIEGYDKEGYDKEGFNRAGYDKDGYDREGFNEEGYDRRLYDRQGFNRQGFNRDGIHRDTLTKYNPKGFNEAGYDKDGFYEDGYNIEGYDKDGFNRWGYNREGYDKEGYNRLGYSEEGYDRRGFDRKGIHKDTLTEYDQEGYDKEGYNREGYDREGIDRTGKTREERAEIQQTQRKNWLGLREKAEKLAKGEMTIEEYIMKSKTSIEELITFAKKEHLSSDTIRGLYKYKKPYRVYTRPFRKKEYLTSTIIIIDGKEVRPTEQDVDMCIEYLKTNGALLCAKNIEDLVRKHLRGEIDITQKGEETTKQELIKKIIEQQETIAEQETEMNRLNTQKKEL